MWATDYINYGAIETSGSEIRVYKDRWTYTRVQCPRPVERAYWAGFNLIVSLSGGETRRYFDNWTYERVG